MKRAPKNTPAPAAPEARPVARDIGPNRETPAEAVAQASSMLQKFGPALAIRAFDLALREHPVTIANAPDVAEATRLARMRRVAL